MGRKFKADWGKADWSMQDVTIASLLGVSKERVGQVRPKGSVSANYRRRTGVTAWQRIMAMDTSGRTIRDVARSVGCGAEYAGMALRKGKKPYRRLPKGNARYDWGLMPANWRELTDKAMAGMVGTSSPAAVTQWRLKHGMRKRGGP